MLAEVSRGVIAEGFGDDVIAEACSGVTDVCIDVTVVIDILTAITCCSVKG